MPANVTSTRATPIDVKDLTPLIEVFDMPASVAFYRDVIGFEVAAQSRPGERFDWALLRLGPASLMLNTAYEDGERPPSPDPRRHAAHRDTTLYFYCPNVDGTYEYLRSKGVDVKPPVNRIYGMRQLSLADPDGYGLCFQYPVEKV